MGAYIPLKNYFGRELAERLAVAIQQHYAEFPIQYFVNVVEENVKPLELKARVSFIAEKFTVHLSWITLTS